MRNVIAAALGLAMLMLLAMESVLAQNEEPAAVTPAQLQAYEENLAEQLANPISSLVSIPFQFNWDSNIGPADDGSRFQINIQPVIPTTLNKDWNLISRTIVPVISQDNIFPGAGDQFGLGDTVQSLFFSPRKPTRGGLIWGAGPVFLLPTATDDLLGADKWGIGPTLVALKQQKGWTYGFLTNHIWSVGGSGRQDISNTFIQPFVSYTNDNAYTFSLQSETTYDWKSEQWSVPINAAVSKVTLLGKQPVSIQGGVRYWADSPESGPEGWGFRVAFTLLYPR